MSDFLHDPFAIFVFVLVFGSLLRALIFQWNVRRKGTEVSAVVTDIIEKEIYNDGHPSVYYDIEVVYATKEGEHIQAILANSTARLKPGDQIRIRYIDEEKEHPVYIGK